MANRVVIGVERDTGRIALGRVACKQLRFPYFVDGIAPSQLPYRALLFNRRTEAYRLAPVRQQMTTEDVAHPAPFAVLRKAADWERPRWTGELP